MLNERRKYAQDLKKFKALITTPATITGGSPLTLPANARLAISSSVSVVADTAKLETVNPVRIQTTPALDADQIYKLDRYHRGQQVNLAGTIGSTVSLYVLDEWMRPSLIGTRAL